VPLWKGEHNEAHFDVWPQNVTCPECKAAFNVGGADELYRVRSRDAGDRRDVLSRPGFSRTRVVAVVVLLCGFWR
jgi:hypothetical protein